MWLTAIVEFLQVLVAGLKFWEDHSHEETNPSKAEAVALAEPASSKHDNVLQLTKLSED